MIREGAGLFTAILWVCPVDGLCCGKTVAWWLTSILLPYILAALELEDMDGAVRNLFGSAVGTSVYACTNLCSIGKCSAGLLGSF